MTAEEFIKSKKVEFFNGRESYYIVNLEDALEAINMAKEEANVSGVFGQQGWICPKCGRVYSPYTSTCSFCGNKDNFKITCNL